MTKKFSFGATKLLRDPSETRVLQDEASLEGLFITSSWVEPTEPIRLVGLAESVHEGILVKARITTHWHGECVRCLGEANGEIDVAVIELFEQGADPEGETYPFDGDVVVMADMVRDNVVLELPIAPLCSMDCKGICQFCGSDLNEGDCGCEDEDEDSPWHALKLLQSDGLQADA